SPPRRDKAWFWLSCRSSPSFPALTPGRSACGPMAGFGPRSPRALSTETRALSIPPCCKSCIPSSASGKGVQAPLALFPRRRASIDERAAAVFVDVDAHDFVERVFGLEAELARAARLDALRPARDDARDQRILGAANARGNAVAGDAPQRRDLLGHGAADARHRKIDAGTESVAREIRGVNEAADRGARARMGVHHRLRNRQHGFETRERLADDPGEETRSRLVGRARPHHDARQADADAVAEAAPGVVGDER